MEKLTYAFIIIAIVISIAYIIFITIKRRRISKKIYNDSYLIYNLLRNDWIKADTNTRLKNISTYREKGVLIYRYVTIKGSVIYMVRDHIVANLVSGKKYNFEIKDDIFKIIFKNFANETIKFVNYAKEDKKDKKTDSGNKKQTGNNSKTKNPNESHPKWNVYQVLLSTAKARKEQLVKTPKNSQGRSSLQCELDAVEGRIKMFKEKYKF